MRNVTVISTQGTGNKVTHATSATTWGQLKTELSGQGVSTDNMKAMVKSNKITLEDSSAELPDGDFTLYLTPSKVKSGKYGC